MAMSINKDQLQISERSSLFKNVVRISINPEYIKAIKIDIFQNNINRE